MTRTALSPADVSEASVLPPVVLEVDLPLLRVRSGKVRECFAAGDRLLIVATDRISAFDVVFAEGIPGKGRVLTGVSRHWFANLDRAAAREGTKAPRAGAAVVIPPRVAHHLLESDAHRIVDQLGLGAETAPLLVGRAMLVRNAVPIPIECVVRGYLDGSALQEYAAGGAVSGIRLPPGLRRGDALREPLFTPATKATAGHDENVTFDRMVELVGDELSERLRQLSLELYGYGAAALAARGLLLADTKFEFGTVIGDSNELLLIDELLTPDSSRIWEASSWEPGHAQPSFDKQPLRDYLEELIRAGRWNRLPPAPALPDEVVRETAERYALAHLRITGESP